MTGTGRGEADAMGGAAPPAPGRVLLVDDDPFILSALRRLLRSHGYEVFLANSGREGIDLLEREEIDVVVSDMRMREMDGAQFLEQVYSRWPETKRILLTGHADVESAIFAVNRGNIWRYLTKPWDNHDLVLSVHHALAHRRLLRENARLQRIENEKGKVIIVAIRRED